MSIFIGVGTLKWGEPGALQLLLISRLPRTAAVLLTGASIAVVGVIMQLLVRNRFVEPSTTGTSEAAMLGLLAVSIFAPAWPLMAKMIVASGAALLGILGFFLLTRCLPPQQPLLIDLRP